MLVLAAASTARKSRLSTSLSVSPSSNSLTRCLWRSSKASITRSANGIRKALLYARKKRGSLVSI